MVSEDGQRAAYRVAATQKLRSLVTYHAEIINKKASLQAIKAIKAILTA